MGGSVANRTHHGGAVFSRSSRGLAGLCMGRNYLPSFSFPDDNAFSTYPAAYHGGIGENRSHQRNTGERKATVLACPGERADREGCAQRRRQGSRVKRRENACSRFVTSPRSCGYRLVCPLLHLPT